MKKFVSTILLSLTFMVINSQSINSVFYKQILVSGKQYVMSVKIHDGDTSTMQLQFAGTDTLFKQYYVKQIEKVEPGQSVKKGTWLITKRDSLIQLAADTVFSVDTSITVLKKLEIKLTSASVVVRNIEDRGIFFRNFIELYKRLNPDKSTGYEVKISGVINKNNARELDEPSVSTEPVGDNIGELTSTASTLFEEFSVFHSVYNDNKRRSANWGLSNDQANKLKISIDSIHAIRLERQHSYRDGKSWICSMFRTGEIARMYRRNIARNRMKARSINADKNSYVAITGNAFSSLSKEQNLTTGLGLYIRKGDLMDFKIFMTVSENKDTIVSDNQRDFGRSLLVPGIRRYSILTDYWQAQIFPYARSPFLKNVGVRLSFNITPMVWKFVRDSLPATITELVPVAIDGLISYTWYNSDRKPGEAKNRIVISSELGATYRGLYGDMIVQDSLFNQNFRLFLGDEPERHYLGLQLSVNFHVNGVNAFFKIPILQGPDVAGLTRGQAIAAIGLRGDLFSLAEMFTADDK